MLPLYLWQSVSICIDDSFTYIMTFYPITWILLIISNVYAIVFVLHPLFFCNEVLPFKRLVFGKYSSKERINYLN